MKRLIARSPGKVILTGEHAVLYQQPAIALAVDCYSTAQLQPLPGSPLKVNLPDLSIQQTFDDLQGLRQRLHATHQGFLVGQQALPLCRADELAAYCCNQGGQLSVTSDIPFGAGMGSSASVLAAIARVSDAKASRSHIAKHASDCEQLVHGRSSGIDVQTSVLGGVQTRYGKTLAPIDQVPSFQIIHTGTPQASTSEVVNHVAQQTFERQKFGALAEEMAHCLHSGDRQGFLQCIRANHRLLVALGVVPPPVQALIRDIERQGGAAKISGAGSHIGEAGGIVIAFDSQFSGDQLPIIEANLDTKGVQLL